MKSIFLFLTLILFSNSYAQKPLKDVYLKRTLKQNSEQFEFTILDEDKHGIWFYSKSKFYFWYKAQGVKSTQGESSGTLLHGKFESFYTNDQLSSKGKFHKGLKNGEWMMWRQDGSLISVEKWSKGDLKSQKWYNETGTVYKIERSYGRNWEKEKADTVILHRKLFKREERIYRDADGKRVQSEKFKKGTRHGETRYYTDGKLERTERYKIGELVSSSDDVKEKPIKEEKAEKVKKEKSEKIKEPKPAKEKKSKKEKEAE